MYVKNRMTSNPYVVAPDSTIAEALELMRKKKVRRLPVVKNGTLVGIITERELLEVSPSKATTLSIFEINYLLAKTTVSEIMTKEVLTIGPDALLEEAALLMRDNNVGALPVVKDGKLVGIITETNIFDSFLELHGFRDVGSRITLELEDKPGVLASVTQEFSDFNVNITHLWVYQSEGRSATVVVRINTLNTDEILASFEKKGYKVVSVLKNEE